MQWENGFEFKHFRNMTVLCGSIETRLCVPKTCCNMVANGWYLTLQRKPVIAATLSCKFKNLVQCWIANSLHDTVET